jgi:hypothetical protein
MVEVGLDTLLGTAFTHRGNAVEDLLVSIGQGRLNDAARPQSTPQHHVGLGGVETELGAKIDPRQRSQYDREGAVDLTRMTKVVAHEVDTNSLQDGPASPAEDSSQPELATTDCRRGQGPKGQPIEGDVCYENQGVESYLKT